jgi:hypothetical protein
MEVSRYCPACCKPGKNLSLKAGLDTLEERKKSYPYQNLNPDHLDHSPVTIPTTLLQLQYLHYK